MVNTNQSPVASAQTQAVEPNSRPPLRFFLTLLELCAIGAFGWLAFASAATLLGLGVFAIIGLLILIGLVYVLYGLAAFEVLRVDGLYALGVEPLQFQKQQAPGFIESLRAAWAQLSQGRMWAALGSFTVTLTLGSGIFQLLIEGAQNLLRSITQMALIARTPLDDQGSLYWLGAPSSDFIVLPQTPWLAMYGPLWHLGLALLSIAGAVGLVFLTRISNIAIIGSSAKVTALSAQAKKAEQRAETNLHQREGAVRAAEVERTRIERDLHDGVQPRLVSVGMTLGIAQQQIDKDPEKAKQLISEAHSSTKAAITELRQLARGIHPSVLDNRGLDAALSALSSRSPIPVSLDVALSDPANAKPVRVSRGAETAVYFAIAESLTNAAKHSKASASRVTVRLRPDSPATHGPRTGILWARIEDNGVGGARVIQGGGIDGVINRVHAAGGSARLDSPLGGPTALEVSVPCEY